MTTAGSDLFDDFPTLFKQWIAATSSLLKDLETNEKVLIAHWMDDLDHLIQDPNSEISFLHSAPLLTLDPANGRLVVNFSDRIVALLREMRQMAAWGVAIPLKMQHYADSMQKLFRHGAVLKQVSNFYNTIGTQMIPCQQPMLLTLAIAFEALVNNPRGSNGAPVTWQNTKEVEDYIGMLQQSASVLTDTNRRYFFAQKDDVTHMKRFFASNSPPDCVNIIFISFN